jgi:hypothetical protein
MLYFKMLPLWSPLHEVWYFQVRTFLASFLPLDKQPRNKQNKKIRCRKSPKTLIFLFCIDRAVAALSATAAAAWPRQGHKNQQSTKNTETTTMPAMTITIETKGTAVAAEARWQRGGSGQLGGGGGRVGSAGGVDSSSVGVAAWRRRRPAWQRRQLGGRVLP